MHVVSVSDSFSDLKYKNANFVFRKKTTSPGMTGKKKCVPTWRCATAALCPTWRCATALNRLIEADEESVFIVHRDSQQTFHRYSQTGTTIRSYTEP